MAPNDSLVINAYNKIIKELKTMKEQSKPIYQKMMKNGLGDIYDDRELPTERTEENKDQKTFSITKIINTAYYYLSYLFCSCCKSKKD